MSFHYKNNFCGPAREKNVAGCGDGGGGGLSIANEFVITKSFRCTPSMVTSPGCSLTVLPVTDPCQVPQPAQGQPRSLQGLLQAPARVREYKKISSARSRLGLYRGRSNAEQQWSFCTAFPAFPLASSKEQALYICTVVHTPLQHSLGLQGTGVTRGFTRTNPNLAGLQQRANESCRTRTDSVQSQMDAFATCTHITSSFC